MNIRKLVLSLIVISIICSIIGDGEVVERGWLNEGG